jgi:hypothetical protein
MRYRYTFEVKSHTQLAETLHFAHQGFRFRLVETGRRFTKLIVETDSVVIPLPSVKQPTPEKQPAFTVPPEPFLDIVIEEVRAIRGALALWGVVDIDVDQPLREFLPETPEETAACQITSIRYQRRDREKLPIVPNTTDLLIRCIVSRGKLAPYEVPLEFHRRGVDDRYREQYVEAIFNFFFVLEYLFAGGKFRSAQVVENFLASPELLAGLAEARTQFLGAIQSEDLAKRFREKYGDQSDEEIVQTIVELRGKLHHQSIKRTNWHPALQKEFEMDADLLGAVCQSVLMAKVLGVLFDRHEKEQFLATPVLDINDKPIPVTDLEQLDA